LIESALAGHRTLAGIKVIVATRRVEAFTAPDYQRYDTAADVDRACVTVDIINKSGFTPTQVSKLEQSSHWFSRLRCSDIPR
jgi:hypothetical protein